MMRIYKLGTIAAARSQLLYHLAPSNAYEKKFQTNLYCDSCLQTMKHNFEINYKMKSQPTNYDIIKKICRLSPMARSWFPPHLAPSYRYDMKFQSKIHFISHLKTIAKMFKTNFYMYSQLGNYDNITSICNLEVVATQAICQLHLPQPHS